MAAFVVGQVVRWVRPGDSESGVTGEVVSAGDSVVVKWDDGVVSSFGSMDARLGFVV